MLGRVGLFWAAIWIATTAIGANYVVPAERGYILNEFPDPIPVLTPSQEKIDEFTKMLGDKTEGIGPAIYQRDVWGRIGANSAFSGIVHKAEKQLSSSNLELYLYAECIENKGRFIPQIEKAIKSICAAPTWVPPIHDVGQGNLKGEEITVDLEASENAVRLATAYHWLGVKLPEDSRKLIRSELERRIFAPVRKHAAGKFHRGMKWMWRENNWNAVCWSRIVIAAMGVLESKEERAGILGTALDSIHYFKDGFVDDGSCEEGPGYWGYGFGHFVIFADAVYQFTGGKIDLMADKTVARMAMFGANTEMLPGVWPSFADCGQNEGGHRQLQNYISRKYQVNADQWQIPIGADAARPEALEDFTWYFPRGIERPCPEYARYSPDACRVWYPIGQVYIGRPAKGARTRIGVAVNGGHNATSHNHNDVGSFCVAIGSQMPIADPGAASYRKGEAFLENRYASQVLSSYGHSVPVVDWHLQMAGRNAQARVVSTEFTEDKDTIVFDIKDAYKVETLDLNDTYEVGTIKKLQRTFVYDRRGDSLDVIDEVEYTRPADFETAVLTLGEFERQPDGSVMVSDRGQSLRVTFDSGGEPYTLIRKHITEPMRRSEYRQPTRLGLRLDKPVTAARLVMHITPADTE